MDNRFELIIYVTVHIQMNVSEVWGSKSKLSVIHEQWKLQLIRRTLVCAVFAVSFLYCRFRMNSGSPYFSQSVDHVSIV